MNIYDLFMIPLEKLILKKIRKKIIALAYGNVLEIGAGTGANLKYYSYENIFKFTILDKKINNVLYKKMNNLTKLIEGTAEQIPFNDNFFDCVVETLVLCSIEDLEKVLSEIKRVLKPNGLFIFIDHVLPENRILSTIFKAINPLWRNIANNCNLVRSPHIIIKKAGFSIENLNCKGPGNVLCFGIAKKI